MTESTQNTRCSHCQVDLPNDHTGPCPQCGKTEKTISVGLAGTIEFSRSLSWKKRREYYEKRCGVLAAVITVTIGAPFLGLFLVGWPGVIVGLLLGAFAFWISPWAVTKVIEIHHG